MKNVQSNNQNEYQEYEKLFYDNLQLFLDNYDKIMAEPKFVNIMWPHRFIGSMYVDCFSKMTLGGLLTIYKNEPKFSIKCSECGEKMYLVFAVVSPLSGIIYRTKSFCPTCGKVKEGEVYKSRDYTSAYGTIKKSCNDAVKQQDNIKPFHITQLINYLKNEIEPQQTDKEIDLPVYYNSMGSGYMKVGKEHITFEN